jgi:hypothetical protein
MLADVWFETLAKPAFGSVYAPGIAVAQAPRINGKPKTSGSFDIRISCPPFVLR